MPCCSHSCRPDLASGKQKRPVPFTALKQDTTAFIPAEYRPPNVTFKDPRNMQLDQIMVVLRHCYDRQMRLGPELAFRFALVVGPNRKHMFATYPDHRQRTASPEKRSRKGKGKQREVNQLDGLLPIAQVDNPNSNCSTGRGEAGPSTRPEPTAAQRPAALATTKRTPAGRLAASATAKRTSAYHPAELATDHRSDLITVGMGEMTKLRNMGCEEIFGPINGPNEGQPQYQVPRHWLERLHDASSNPDPDPAQPTTVRPYPRPRPIMARPPQRADSTPSESHLIDPSLLQSAISDNNTNIMQASSSTSANVVPTTVYAAGGIIDTDTALLPNRQSNTSRKRDRVTKSPNRPVTRSSKQRRIMTSDALAMQEAETLLKFGKRDRAQKKRK
jgi:hypothetical protein